MIILTVQIYDVPNPDHFDRTDYTGIMFLILLQKGNVMYAGTYFTSGRYRKNFSIYIHRYWWVGIESVQL